MDGGRRGGGKVRKVWEGRVWMGNMEGGWLRPRAVIAVGSDGV